jgi:alcohol dehydrogenase
LIETLQIHLPTKIVRGPGLIARLGELGEQLGFRRALLVADAGITSAGITERAAHALAASGIEVCHFAEFTSNPDTAMVENGRAFAAAHRVDSIVGLGGGSSLDCAKGINFLLTGGGRMNDYLGYGKARSPMLPMIGVPTTAGTGSEAQSYALISDAETHVKMACGDPGAAFRIAILDPELTLTQPRAVTAAAGFDAIAHAVETHVTTARSSLSEALSREAWKLLEANYERVLQFPSDLEARSKMQLGAFFAGAAIEKSMLGATHACANPLTARYGTDHGVAIAVLLPWVVRWNDVVVRARYDELMELMDSRSAGQRRDGLHLAERLEELRAAGGFATSLRSMGVPREDLPLLADGAAEQWTGRFNPRLFDSAGAMEIYEWAY